VAAPIVAEGNVLVDIDDARVADVDVGELVGPIVLALGKVTVGSVGIKIVGTVGVKLGTFGTGTVSVGTVGAVPLGSGVQF